MIIKRNLRNRVSNRNSNRRLYESIMRDVAKTVKRHLNESGDYDEEIDDEIDEILRDENISPNSSNITKLVDDFTNKVNNIINQCELINLGLDTGIEIGILENDNIHDIYNDYIEYVYLDEDFNTSKKIFALASKYPKRLHIDINTHPEALDDSINYEDLFDDLEIYLNKKYRNKIELDNGAIYFVHMKHTTNIKNLINLTLQVLQDFIMYLNENYKDYIL